MKSVHQKVYLIRHGETEWTKSKKHTGLTDIPLTAEGEKQSLWLKEALSGKKFKKVFCSPLQRAKKTCEIAGFFHEAEIDRDLLEWDYGKYEGMTTSEIHEIDPGWTIFSRGAPEGESVGDVGGRAQRMLSKILSVSGDVAVFSSGHFSRVLAAKWLHLSAAEGRLLALSTASLSILGYEHGLPVLHLWNQTGTYSS
jgi:broad specificity phosphatase PhoE